MNDFNAVLARRLTALKLSMRSKLRADSVALKYSTKTSIRDALEELRDAISSSNLSDAVKAALHRKADAVEEELDKPRSSLRPLWTLLGALGMMAATTVGLAADLPDAIETLQSAASLTHDDKRDEEQATRLHERPLLGHNPQRLLEDGTGAETI